MLTASLAAALLAAASPAPNLAVPRGTTAWAYASGALSEPLAGPPEQAAVAFARAHARELGLVPGAELVATDVFGTTLGPTVLLRQRVNGLPVLRGDVSIGLDRQGRVARVSSGSAAFAPEGSRPALPRAAAIEVAFRLVPAALLGPTGAPQGAARLAYAFAGEHLRLAWQVYVPSLDLLHNEVFAIDAESGAVLLHENRVQTADTAQVFEKGPLPDGGGLVTLDVPDLDGGAPDAGGFISGTRASAVNCCPNAGCVPGAPSKRADGGISFGFFTVKYDVAICERTPEANNRRDDGGSDYLYPPIDPPPAGTTQVTGPTSDPSEYDAFAEPEAYTHVLQQYDFFRELSGPSRPFTLEDNKDGGQFLVWTNILIPHIDFNQALSGHPVTSDVLDFVDNAAFVTKENWQQQPGISEVYPLNSSAMVFFQGARADFSYDTSVTYHEFTHGMINTVANFTGVALYAHGGNDEAGAMNEGLADYFAAAHLQDPAIGPYVGPRISGQTQNVPLRDLTGQDHCPDVLWGEVHQDSMHFSQALWTIRQGFLGADQGRTFDAAVYAGVVGIQQPTFDTLTSAVCTAVEASFNGAADEQTCRQGFAARGVIGCDHILDAAGTSVTRDYFGVPGLPAANYGQLPGPIEFKLHASGAATQVVVRGQTQGGGNPLGGGQPKGSVLVSVGQPVTFSGSASGAVQDDAQHKQPMTLQGNALGATVALSDVPCGGADVYVAVVNTDTSANLTSLALSGLSVSLTDGPGCGTSSGSAGSTGGSGSSGGSSGGVTGGTSGGAGSTGAGSTSGGAAAGSSGSTGSSGGAKTSGCGCQAAGASPLLALGLGLLGLRRRRR